MTAGLDKDTIAAIATPAGRGAVGIVRISGPGARRILEKITGDAPPHRQARLRAFRARDGTVIDKGLVLYFEGPGSFTGEDVAELQGHGGPVVMDMLLAATLAEGARIARPGEFSERAFLNGRMDLAQAEAVADLIDSASRAAARSAARSLQGEFSGRIDALAEQLVELRVYVEASIDFPEDEVDFLMEGEVASRLDRAIGELDRVAAQARQGVLLTEGVSLVLAGAPNVGKSSLLNRLAGVERAIVTEVPGTTRDVLSEQINLDGIPVRLIDTAGLRASTDRVEQEGIRRARAEIAGADWVLWVCDAADEPGGPPPDGLPGDRTIIVRNKIDLVPHASRDGDSIAVSALTGEGVDALKTRLKQTVGYREAEGTFSARRRHLDALARARTHLAGGRDQLRTHAAGELLAEDLRAAHETLGEIVGRMTPDALLGRIFSSFCIGK